MANIQCLVSYSWASDHPNGTNRSLIERALRNAADVVRGDDTIQVEPVIDRDTQGVPGAPDIASTIFAKIERAQIFVCDITIVDEGMSRPAPNPNVLLELGYALHVLGPDRIIMVMNTAFGAPELLPFDLRMRRVMTYHTPEQSDNRGEARKRLESMLVEALRSILQGQSRPSPGEIIQPQTPAHVAREAVEAGMSGHVERVRQYMESLGEQVATLTPKRDDEDQGLWDEQLVAAIHATEEMALEFTLLANSIVAHNADDAAHALHDGFSHLLELYRNPLGFSGTFYPSDFDLPRFVGHELFATLCALLVRSARWELLADLLESDLYVKDTERGVPGMVSFTALSDFVRLLQQRNQRLRLGRRLLHADLLNERHTGGMPLALALPMEQFAAGDYFLYLRGQLQPEQAPADVQWRPWSVVYLQHPPRFLVESTQARVARQICRPLGVPDIDSLRARLRERAYALGRFFSDPFWHDVLDELDPQAIGTR